MILVTFLILLACYIIISFILHYRSGGKAVRKTPPSPPKLPLIGNLHQLGHLPHRSLHAMAQKYGPIMLLHLGQVPTLIISSADAVAEILKEHDHIFSGRPVLQIPSKLFYGGKDIAFAPYGDYWRHIKKIITHHLLSAQKVKSFKHIREEEVSSMVRSVSEMHTLGPVELTHLFDIVAKQITCRITIGRSSSNDDWYDQIHDVIKEVTVMIGSFNPADYFTWMPWIGRITGLERKLNKLCEWGDQILDNIIEKRLERLRDGEKEECFLDTMLKLVEEESTDIPFEIDNVKAIIMDTFGAGTEATSLTMEWVMAELLKNPQAMKKLQAEIRSIARSKHFLQEEDLVGMTYLKAIIKEVLRLHPPGPLLAPRQLTEDVNVRGYCIPRGTHVLFNAWGIARDSKVWDAADEFRPERFLESCVDFTSQDFEFIPFGAGRRMCPGTRFGMAIVELTIANLVLKFDWSLPEGAEEMDMEELFGISMRKKTKLCVVACHAS